MDIDRFMSFYRNTDLWMQTCFSFFVADFFIKNHKSLNPKAACLHGEKTLFFKIFFYRCGLVHPKMSNPHVFPNP